MRRLSLKGDGHQVVCQRGRWAPKGVNTRQYASKDAEPEGGGLGSPTSIGEGTSGAPKGVNCEILYQLGRRTRYPL